MTDQQRRRAFAFSAVVIAIVATLVWVLERPGGGPADGAGRAGKPQRPLVLDETPAPPDAGPTPTRSRPTRRPPATAPLGKAEIERTAARFTAGFVHYEVGEITVAVRRAIQGSATPEFAASLLNAPPSIPPGTRPPPPGRVREVTLANGPEGGSAAVAVELTSADGEISELTEMVERTGREWRVNALG